MLGQTSARFIPVDFLTSSHYIFGQIKVFNAGVMGILSDPNASYIEISEASIARVQTPDQVINYAPAMWIAKERLVALCLNRREHVGPQAVLRGGYARIFEYPVHVTTTVYELRGILEWAGRFEFSVLMGEGKNAFFVLHKAVLVSTLFPKLKIEKEAMVFNRLFLDTLMMMKKEG
jgi:hypothetical protein